MMQDGNKKREREVYEGTFDAYVKRKVFFSFAFMATMIDAQSQR